MLVPPGQPARRWTGSRVAQGVASAQHALREGPARLGHHWATLLIMVSQSGPLARLRRPRAAVTPRAYDTLLARRLGDTPHSNSPGSRWGSPRCTQPRGPHSRPSARCSGPRTSQSWRRRWGMQRGFGPGWAVLVEILVSAILVCPSGRPAGEARHGLLQETDSGAGAERSATGCFGCRGPRPRSWSAGGRSRPVRPAKSRAGWRAGWHAGAACPACSHPA